MDVNCYEAKRRKNPDPFTCPRGTSDFSTWLCQTLKLSYKRVIAVLTSVSILSSGSG